MLYRGKSPLAEIHIPLKRSTLRESHWGGGRGGNNGNEGRREYFTISRNFTVIFLPTYLCRNIPTQRNTYVLNVYAIQ